MTMLPTIVLSEDVHPAGKALLEGKAQLILAPDTTEATAARLLAEAEALCRAARRA